MNIPNSSMRYHLKFKKHYNEAEDKNKYILSYASSQFNNESIETKEKRYNSWFIKETKKPSLYTSFMYFYNFLNDIRTDFVLTDDDINDQLLKLELLFNE